MSKLKSIIVSVIILDLILVFPVMLSYKKVGEWFKVRVAQGGSPEVFVTLLVEITLLTVTAIISYMVSRILKGTPFQSALYLIGWGVFFYGIGDVHILAWMYTGVESVYPSLGPASSSIAHALGVGLGFILVILGLYKIASARKNLVSNEQIN
ncbi:MAG: hypothetical protein KGJ58_00315 [Patescibacteria group bacterium]|nr:hypothetical protein [Patescibacteria group bacterium]MDE1988384.1 hypothetical protein [Patescibacteria group bacterium]MDE2217885.1 hypothetical protein [Patescibacteria group bacterium]